MIDTIRWRTMDWVELSRGRRTKIFLRIDSITGFKETAAGYHIISDGNSYQVSQPVYEDVQLWMLEDTE